MQDHTLSDKRQKLYDKFISYKEMCAMMCTTTMLYDFNRITRNSELFDEQSLEDINALAEKLVRVYWKEVKKKPAHIPSKSILSKNVIDYNNIHRKILNHMCSLANPGPIIISGKTGLGKSTIAQSAAEINGYPTKTLSIDTTDIEDMEAIISSFMVNSCSSIVNIILDDIENLSDINHILKRSAPRCSVGGDLPVRISTENVQFIFVMKNEIDTDSDIDNILSFERYCLMLNLEEYTKSKKVEIVSKKIIPMIKKKYKIPNRKFNLTKQALEYIVNCQRSVGFNIITLNLNRLAVNITKMKGDKKTPINKPFVFETLKEYGTNFDPFNKYGGVGQSNIISLDYRGGELSTFQVKIHDYKKKDVYVTGTDSKSVIDSCMNTTAYLNLDARNLSYCFLDNIVGPSAGVSIFMAIWSAKNKVSIPDNIAYTGEFNLSGAVTRIGGVVEKLAYSDSIGVKHVFIPKGNEQEYLTIKEHLSSSMKVHVVSHIDEVIEAVELIIKNRSRRLKK